MTPNLFAIAIGSLTLKQCEEMARMHPERDTIPCPPPDFDNDPYDSEALTLRDTHYDVGDTLPSAQGRTTAILPAARQSAA